MVGEDFGEAARHVGSVTLVRRPDTTTQGHEMLKRPQGPRPSPRMFNRRRSRRCRLPGTARRNPWRRDGLHYTASGIDGRPRPGPVRPDTRPRSPAPRNAAKEALAIVGEPSMQPCETSPSTVRQVDVQLDGSSRRGLAFCASAAILRVCVESIIRPWRFSQICSPVTSTWHAHSRPSRGRPAAPPRCRSRSKVITGRPSSTDRGVDGGRSNGSGPGTPGRPGSV